MDYGCDGDTIAITAGTRLPKVLLVGCEPEYLGGGRSHGFVSGCRSGGGRGGAKDRINCESNIARGNRRTCNKAGLERRISWQGNSQKLQTAFLADKETLYMLGGVAMVVFGARLILSNPLVRRYLGQIGIGNLAQAALPDIDRYLRLRNM
ncbi:MAG TPA: hypothetical protein VGL74_13430 [Terriglobales bacterium]